MYYSKDAIEQARRVDLLTYLQRNEPDALHRVSPSVYCTKEHDSLRISNGKWYWFSQGFGGCSALDYLVKVRDIPFTQAVGMLIGQAAIQPPVFASIRQIEKTMILPNRSPSSEKVATYLLKRGIHREVIDHCLQAGLLYESLPHHNAVFVGFDPQGKPRYAALRGISSDFKGEAKGSDKRFSFSIPARDSKALNLFEGAIDLLSYATLKKLDGRDWRREHLLSLGGVSGGKSLPPALKQFLQDHVGVENILLRLDNDDTGRKAAAGLMELLEGQYQLSDLPPPQGKDYNDWLLMRLQRRTE